MTEDKSGKKKKRPGFEESLKRLEGIVGNMESGKLNLEDMIAHFEEGQGLIKFCSEKLNEVERKIEMLVKKGDAIVAEPFDEEHGDGSAAENSPPERKTEEGELF